MNRLQEIEKLAKELMEQHGLEKEKWFFKFDRAKRRAGCCHYPNAYKPGVISLSHFFATNNSDEDVRDTILHEIAHAIAGFKAGHGYEWRAVCRRIGAKPERCYNSKKIVMPPKLWKANCPCCNKEFGRNRISRGFVYSCRACGNERGKLNYQRRVLTTM